MKVNIDEMQKEMHYGWTSSKGNQNKWRIDGGCRKNSAGVSGCL